MKLLTPVRVQTALLLTLLCGLLAGCSSLRETVNGLGVEPWERGTLARPDMLLDAQPLTAASDDHIYFSKEASNGGRSFAGGGCGCN